VLTPIAIGSWRGASVRVGLGGAHGALRRYPVGGRLKRLGSSPLRGAGGGDDTR
jgi:hypothetical protein